VKFLLLVLSAAVLSGLGVYAAFDSFGWFGLLGSNVTMHVDTFVAVIATVGAVAAALALALRAALGREERRFVQSMEQRIARLESSLAQAQVARGA
jgi:hypothetical protein